MSETTPSESARHANAKTQAQEWGRTAVAFIASATATGVFALLAYVLWAISWLALTCLGLAAIAFVVLAIQSLAIIKWWIIIAKR